MPQIDWSFYRNKIAAPGMVDSFEKGVCNYISENKICLLSAITNNMIIYEEK